MDDRLMDLEIKVAFQEKQILDLDDVVRTLRDQLDEVRAELERLTEHLRVQSGETVDEKPPHYGV